MYYELNVSLNGQHYFATADRSVRDLPTAKEMYKTFSEAFPAEKGYEITVTYKETTGRRLDMSIP